MTTIMKMKLMAGFLFTIFAGVQGHFRGNRRVSDIGVYNFAFAGL